LPDGKSRRFADRAPAAVGPDRLLEDRPIAGRPIAAVRSRPFDRGRSIGPSGRGPSDRGPPDLWGASIAGRSIAGRSMWGASIRTRRRN
jgi:hypothetical protein